MKNWKKNKKNSSNFCHFFVIFLNKKMTLTHKTVTNCYHKIAQVEGVSSIHIWATNKIIVKKTQKWARKSAKYIKNLRIIIKFRLISRNLQTTTETSLKLNQNHNQTSYPKWMKKNCFKMPHVNKKISLA